jgi:hypothetical protein
MNRFRNRVIRHFDAAERRVLPPREGLAALREHRATNKAAGKARKSGWRRRLPQWLRDFLHGEVSHGEA